MNGRICVIKLNASHTTSCYDVSGSEILVTHYIDNPVLVNMSLSDASGENYTRIVYEWQNPSTSINSTYSEKWSEKINDWFGPASNSLGVDPVELMVYIFACAMLGLFAIAGESHIALFMSGVSLVLGKIFFPQVNIMSALVGGVMVFAGIVLWRKS